VTLIKLQNQLKQRIQAAAQELFNVSLDQVSAETPPKPELGDLAFPVSFELAKLIKQSTGTKVAPRAIAEQLKEKLAAEGQISGIEVAGAGYLNIFFDRAQLLTVFAATRSSERAAEHGASVTSQPKEMVEHTSINPNKAAHIGHVRNAVLGDTFVRVLEAAGNTVEVQNYIDNTGV